MIIIDRRIITFIYRCDGEVNGTLLQYSFLENPMGGGAWWAAVHGVARSWTRLSNFTFTFYFHALEKEMATHSSVLAWRILGTGEPGGLPSMGSHRVGHDWFDLAAAAAAAHRIQTFKELIEYVSYFHTIFLFFLSLFYLYQCKEKKHMPFFKRPYW